MPFDAMPEPEPIQPTPRSDWIAEAVCFLIGLVTVVGMAAFVAFAVAPVLAVFFRHRP